MADLDSMNTISERARENVDGEDHWAPLVNAMSNPWSPANADGK